MAVREREKKKAEQEDQRKRSITGSLNRASQEAEKIILCSGEQRVTC